MKDSIKAIGGAAVVFLGLWAIAPAANAADVCTFQTSKNHYATTKHSPNEVLRLSWRTDTDEVLDFHWEHQANGQTVLWYPFAAAPGTVHSESGPRWNVDLGITTAGFEDFRYRMYGKLAVNISLPAATFAVIYEGTGTAWDVAYGEVACAPM